MTFDSYYQANLHYLQLKNEFNNLSNEKDKFNTLIKDLEYICSELGRAAQNVRTADVNYRTAYQTDGGDKKNRSEFAVINAGVKGIKSLIENKYKPNAEKKRDSLNTSMENKSNEMKDIYYYEYNYATKKKDLKKYYGY